MSGSINRATTLYRVSQGTNSVSIDEAECVRSLDMLSKAELESLNNDSTKLNDFIFDKNLDIDSCRDLMLKQYENDKEMLIASNKSLADYNISLRPQIVEARERLAERYEQLKELKETYQRLNAEVTDAEAGPALEDVHVQLQFKVTDSESQAEQLSEKFREGEMDVDSFIKSYLEQQTNTHLLKVKAEKLNDIIHQRPQQPQVATAAPPTYHQTPYPTYNSGMPQASMYMPQY